MTNSETQGIKDINTILDYYTKSALSHSGYILACFFGIFSILTIITRLSRVYSLLTSLLLYAAFVGIYATIVSFALYEIRRWHFYSSRAKYIADFTKRRLRENKDFRKVFCEVFSMNDQWFENLLKYEWAAVGANRKKSRKITQIFRQAEQMFFAFCTLILVVTFSGIYNEKVAILNLLEQTVVIIVLIAVYTIISSIAYSLLRKLPSLI